MTNDISAPIEYMTIFAPTAAEAIDQFSRLGLATQGYSITGQVGRHLITVVDTAGETQPFRDGGMVAATFHRRIAAQSA